MTSLNDIVIPPLAIVCHDAGATNIIASLPNLGKKLITQNTSNLNFSSWIIISLLFFTGILFFSGSIYAITSGISAKNIWFITPIGGLLFIIGWLKIALSFNKNK